mgnify:CR=1 FL=1
MNYKNYHKKRNSGYTLIEIMLAIAILVAISTIGFYSLDSFNKSRDISDSYLYLVNTLSEARSSALAEIKPVTHCAEADTVVGYRVKIFPTYYVMDVVCFDNQGRETSLERKRILLPPSVTLSSTFPTILFDTNGESTNSGVITLTKNGIPKSVSINSKGAIISE